MRAAGRSARIDYRAYALPVATASSGGTSDEAMGYS
jgi:hypothetical protein